MSLMRPLSSMRSDFDRLFSDLEREFFSPILSGRRPNDALESMTNFWAPPVDIHETENEVIMKASVPGLKPEEIDLEIEGKIVTISGETKDEREEKDKSYYRREIVQGRFYRQVQLPCEVISDQANAHFENGMLIVTMPKSEQTRRQKIKISQ